MIKILYGTTSKYKFDLAEEYLSSKNQKIELVQLDVELPEIQSENLKEIVKFSLEWMLSHYNENSIVSDVGYFIPSKNGFPGPFIKWINRYLNADDILRLMEDTNDRRLEIRDCLGIIQTNGEIRYFTSSVNGTISNTSRGERGTAIDKVFIPNGFDTTLADSPEEAVREFWLSTHTHWKELSDFMDNMSSC